jgi:WD40 repeat protein
MPKGSRLVSAIAISKDDKRLAASDMSEKIIIHLFDLSDDSAINPIADVQINQKVMQILWNPHDASQFASVGKDHMMICSFDEKDNKLTRKAGKMESRASMSSVAWSQNPANKGTLFSGGSNGKVHIWSGTSLSKQHELSKGAVQSLCSSLTDENTEHLYASGSDFKVTMFKIDGKTLQ